jgi:hypothetical protein
MHGQQTLKFLNEKAAADAIMAKHKFDETDPKLEAEFQKLLAAKAAEKLAK